MTIACCSAAPARAVSAARSCRLPFHHRTNYATGPSPPAKLIKTSIRANPLAFGLSGVCSVADPNPDPDPPDPHVFGPPGSGSTRQRYGSGSGSCSVFAFNLSRPKRKRSFILGKVKYRSETNSTSVQLVKIEAKTNWLSKTVHESERKRKKSNSKIEAKARWFSLQFLQDETKRNGVLTLSTTKQKRPGCSKILEE